MRKAVTFFISLVFLVSCCVKVETIKLAPNGETA